MAEALVSVVLEQLGSIVIHELAEEVKLLVGVEDEVDKLTETLTMIAAVLQDAEEKQLKNNSVKLWLEKLKDISYDADDILDEWFNRSLISGLQQPDVNAPIGKKVQFHLNYLRSCFKPVAVRHELAIKIRDLNVRLEEIVKMKETFNLIPTEGRSHEEPRTMTSSLIDISAAFGRDDDVKKIVSMLLSESSHDNLPTPVISIVGTGGFGKTTLAQLILKEKQVIAKFEKNIWWVCVSEPFNIDKVAKEIIELATGSATKAVGWQAVHESLSKAVKGKQFLLVLDDVWSYNEEEWRQLKLSLDGGGMRSRIIVTTRNERIGMMMGSTDRDIHRLGRLSEDASLSLFRRIAFQGRDNDDVVKYEEIAREITEKCKGVPLAVKTLAGLMRFKNTTQEWSDVSESDIWKIQEVEKSFLPSLMLSYYALPYELKPCFMYCAIFSKDATIKKDVLIKLWMAQGFLGSSGADGSENLEKIGEDYFDNLVMRSFFQGFKKDYEGNIVSCMMHDLVHDFAQFLSRRESFILEEGKKLSSVKIRHLGVGYSKIDDASSIYKESCLRTLIPSEKLYPSESEGWWDNGTVPLDIFNKLKYLRALSLYGRHLEKVPDEVGKLLHLRFLDLSLNNFVVLPEAICGLPNLHTLILYYCENLRKLPTGLGKLSNLRHLDTRYTDALLYYPPGIGSLSHLRTLEKFIVGDGDGGEEGCKLKDLKLLNHLQGNLTVSVRKRVADVNEGKEGKEAELKNKVKLRCLMLEFGDEVAGDEEDILGILEGFQPHRNLETLFIQGYPGFKLPFWISSLSNLVTLQVYRCRRLQLPAMGRLASLESLKLINLPSLKHIGSEWYGLDNIPHVGNSNTNNGSGGSGSSVRQQKVVIFPKLKSLELEDCEKLEEWDMPLQNHLEYFPNLSELTVEDCTVLRVLPAFGMLKSLERIYFLKLDGIKRLSLDLLGISSGVGESASAGPAIYPALKHLTLRNMPNWGEEEEILPRNNGENGIAAATIMPCLTTLEIWKCPKLKVIPEYLFPEALENLRIGDCPQLTGTQPCLPLHLGSLELEGDLGVVTSSFFSFGVSRHNSYPNLKTLHIFDSQRNSLPEGFNLLTGIQTLKNWYCDFLDFLPEDLKHLTMLEKLDIRHCPLLQERFTEEVISQLLQRV